MKDIIAAGSEAHVVVGSEAFFAEDTDFAQRDDEVDVEEETQASEDLGGKGKKKRKSGEPSVGRYKWAPKEYECLAEAWKMVSMDPITSSNQSGDTYWIRIKAAFDERKMVDPKFNTTYMDRGAKAMANHWAAIQTACNKWHGVQEEVNARPESGASADQKV